MNFEINSRRAGRVEAHAWAIIWALVDGRSMSMVGDDWTITATLARVRKLLESFDLKIEVTDVAGSDSPLGSASGGSLSVRTLRVVPVLSTSIDRPPS